MDLIYIYGPPGVGKFTVGKALSRLTGYKLFHNQLSIEFVKNVFNFGTPSFNKLVLKFRAEMIEEAAKNDTSLIFTSAYAKGFNERIMKDLVKRVEKSEGRVCFVQLYCDKEVLLERVKNRSRKSFYKINSSAELSRLLKKYNHLSSISFRKSFRIDNTNINPQKAARMIISHYGLKQR